MADKKNVIQKGTLGGRIVTQNINWSFTL